MSVTDFAVIEYKRYLLLAGISGVELSASIDESIANEKHFSRFGYPYDANVDDAFSVAISCGSGKIIGTNPRATLLGVYDLLRRMGFMFIRAGADGEYIPTGLRKENLNFNYTHNFEYRVRGIAPCSPMEIESIKDYLDWLPKIGLNTHMREFASNHMNFKSWYMHEENPYLTPQSDYSVADSFRYDKALLDVDKRRGLIYQTMGHGWNVSVISNDLYNDMAVLPDTKINYEYCAMVGGERKVVNNFIRCTNLCLSNLEVQQKLIDNFCKYLKNNPDVDTVYFFLGDSLNNACECDKCRRKTPTEWFSVIADKLDKKLTGMGSDIKIVFAIYVDLYFPSKNAKFNPNRYILMYAPIGRDFSRSYDEFDFEKIDENSIPKFKLNDNVIPTEIDKNLAFYKAWQKCFDGETFLWDFQNYYTSRYDVSNLRSAELIVRDIKSFDKYEFNGEVGCFFYRNAFPHAWSTYAFARALSDGAFDYESEKQSYFNACYGEMKEPVLEYLELVKRALPLEIYQRYGENGKIGNVSASDLDEGLINELISKTQTIKEQINVWQPPTKLLKTSKLILNAYLVFIDGLARIFLLKKFGKASDKMLKIHAELKEYFLKNERELLPHVDVDHILIFIKYFCNND